MGLKNRQPVWALPVGRYELIGAARFNMQSGITEQTFWGVINSVTFVSLSLVNIGIWPPIPITQYMISGSASSDGTNASFVAINTANGVSHTAYGFQIQVVGITPFTGRNSSVVCLNIHGRTPNGA